MAPIAKNQTATIWANIKRHFPLPGPQNLCHDDTIALKPLSYVMFTRWATWAFALARGCRFYRKFTLWCLLTIIVKSFVAVFNSLGPSEAFVCVSKLNTIGSDNGLSPTRRQAIIWTNAGILSIRPLRTNFSEIFIEVYTFSFKKLMHSKMSSGKWRPFCLGLNILRHYIQIIHSIHIGDELVLLDYQIISRSKLHVNKCWAMC